MKRTYLNFTLVIKIIAICISIALVFIIISPKSFAATGINRVINFQGKVVNKTAGTNVTNGAYDLTFKLYTAPSGGSLLWTETHSAGNSNQITVTDGIFRVGLGDATTGCKFDATDSPCKGATNSAVDFNSDSLYLDITFNGETMGSRIQFTAVPYAFEAEKVSGLTVTNNGGNTLNIAANKTFTVSNTLTLAGTDSTSFTFPSTGGGTILVNNISGQSIAGAFSLTGTSGDLTLAGTTGLTFSGTGGQINFTLGETIDNDTDGILKFTAPNASFSGTLTVGQGQTIRPEYGPLSLAYKSAADAWTTGITLQDTTGNVGIGTADPLSQLQVHSASAKGTIDLTGANGGDFRIAQGSAIANGYVSLTFTSPKLGLTRSGTHFLWYDTGIGDIVLNNTFGGASNLKLAYGGTSVLDINSTKNIGIGISSPISQFHLTRPLSFGATGKALAIFDQIEDQDIFTASKSGVTKFTIDQNGGASMSGTLTLENGQTIRPAYGPLQLAYKSGGDAWTTGITLEDTTGDVGIGTADPKTNLHVLTSGTTSLGALVSDRGIAISGGQGTNRIYFERTEGTTGKRVFAIDNGNTDGILSFSSLSDAANAFVTENILNIRYDGNIGVGTVTPNAKLDVNGTASVSGTLTIGNGTTNQLRSAYGPLQLAYKSAADTWTTGITLQDTTGRVGIGTSSPSDVLEVANGGLTFSSTTLGNNGSVNVTINAGSTGTTATLLVKLDTSGTVVTTNTTTLNEAVGVALDTKTSGQAVRVATQGVVTATADNTVTAGDYIGVGTTTAGRAKSLGTTYPTTTGVQVIGRALAGASAGSTFLLMLNGLDNNAGGGGMGVEAQIIFFSNSDAITF